MINLLVTIFGGLMIIAGFYAMSYGFTTPPNILLFLLGLIMAVAGLFLVVIFSSGIQMPEKRAPTPSRHLPQPAPVMKPRPKPVKVEKKTPLDEKKKEKLETIEKIKPQPRIRKPQKVDRPDMIISAEDRTSRLPPEKPKVEPKKKDEVKKPTTKPPVVAFKTAKIEESLNKPAKAEPSKEEAVDTKVDQIKPIKSDEIKAEPIKPVKTEEEQVKPKPRILPRIRRLVENKKEPEIIVEHDKPGRLENLKQEIGKPEADKPDVKPRITAPVKADEPKKPPVIKRPDLSKLKSSNDHENEDEYVKKRLERMKESYIQNTKDIESIIDERLDSFRGTIGKLKSESQEPGIIWSFDADNVQEALKETISKANHRILMMYPWIRNIDVAVLKKFMETESSIIVQEASLDDDASVELLKLLQDKNVKIRTMPHVHTIAVAADDANGLIISTDPIYESYEVGVVYKDKKSVEEIERLFEDAWEISQDIDLEIK